MSVPPIRSNPLEIDCPAVGVLITATVMAGQEGFSHAKRIATY